MSLTAVLPLVYAAGQFTTAPQYVAAAITTITLVIITILVARTKVRLRTTLQLIAILNSAVVAYGAYVHWNEIFAPTCGGPGPGHYPRTSTAFVAMLTPLAAVFIMEQLLILLERPPISKKND